MEEKNNILLDKFVVISTILKDWYSINQRDLPWRLSKDPYIIWISEIILQQTRVVQGLDYFNRFVERFPDVQRLAKAEEAEVLKYWEGLGYYSRARNLHFAAQTIVNEYQGKFPQEKKEILKLKGIGEYTASAILSFSFNKPYAVVDGNVYRVIARLFGIDTPIDTTSGKHLFADLAMELLDKKNPEVHNQAIMEFGALQCVPMNPSCVNCPLNNYCEAFSNNLIERLPVKSKKVKVRLRFLNYIQILYKGTTWISLRNKKDIWRGLYELPLIETTEEVDSESFFRSKSFQNKFGDIDAFNIKYISPLIKHQLTHQTLFVRIYQIEIEKTPLSIREYLNINMENIRDYAYPILLKNYFEKNI